jgi:phage I-like protein
VDPSIRKGIQKRREWIRRHPGGTAEGFPGGALDYIRLSKSDREKVDKLFLANRRLKANEVNSLVEKLTEKRLRSQRISNVKTKALANLRARLSDATRYRDATVVNNVKKMSPAQAKKAAAATVDELITLARVQEEGNPFWYH